MCFFFAALIAAGKIAASKGTTKIPKPLLVHDSMLLLSTLTLSSYSIIVVMLGWDFGGEHAHGN